MKNEKNKVKVIKFLNKKKKVSECDRERKEEEGVERLVTYRLVL